MKRNRGWLTALIIGLFSASALAQHQTIRLELIPPSPVTDKVILDIRGAWDAACEKTGLWDAKAKKATKLFQLVSIQKTLQVSFKLSSPIGFRAQLRIPTKPISHSDLMSSITSGAKRCRALPV